MGYFIDGKDALDSLERLSTKQVKPTTTFRGLLSLGDCEKYGEMTLSIPIFVYNKTSELKLPSAKKWSDLADKVPDNVKKPENFGSVQQDTVYRFVPDEDGEDTTTSTEKSAAVGEQVDKEDLIRAYRFGQHWIPFTKEDEDLSALQTTKKLDIIQFTSSSNVPQYIYKISN